LIIKVFFLNTKYLHFLFFYGTSFVGEKMTFNVANKLNENFVLDKEFNLVLEGTKQKLDDAMCKGYVYANLFFYAEVQKEIEKLRKLVRKIHDEVVLELNLSPDEPAKLLMELSMRMRNIIGEDSLDAIIKEMLAEKVKHMALMVDKREYDKLNQISEAIFMEITAAFFEMTLQNTKDLEDGVKTFRFSKEYIEKMTDRQKRLITPALRMIGFENQIKLNNLDISQDWTVKYIPERLPVPFTKQEATIKDQLKNFIQKNLT